MAKDLWAPSPAVPLARRPTHRAAYKEFSEFSLEKQPKKATCFHAKLWEHA